MKLETVARLYNIASKRVTYDAAIRIMCNLGAVMAELVLNNYSTTNWYSKDSNLQRRLTTAKSLFKDAAVRGDILPINKL